MMRYVCKVIQNPGAWVKLGDKEFYGRSKWERNYARYLQFQKEKGIIHDWFHEPYTFWFHNIMRGVRSFLPDFKVCPRINSHYWVEVKGHMDDKSATKLKRMAKYYPDELVVLIDKKWFVKNNEKMRIIIKDWE